MYVDEFELNLNKSMIDSELGLSNGKLLKVVDAAAISYLREYMPRDGGVMSANTYETTPGEILINTPYAHYQNEGIVYVMPSNGKAAFYDSRTGRYWSKKGEKKIPSSRRIAPKGKRGPHFVERAINENYTNILKVAQREIDSK